MYTSRGGFTALFCKEIYKELVTAIEGMYQLTSIGKLFLSRPHYRIIKRLDVYLYILLSHSLVKKPWRQTAQPQIRTQVTCRRHQRTCSQWQLAKIVLFHL